MDPSTFFTIVLPLGIIVFVLVTVVYYLSKKTELTNYEKELKEIRNSYFKGKIDNQTFQYMRDNLKAENHFFSESRRIDKLFKNKKIDTETYLRMKKILENSFNTRLVRIHDNYSDPKRDSKKDFDKYLLKSK